MIQKVVPYGQRVLDAYHGRTLAETNLAKGTLRPGLIAGQYTIPLTAVLSESRVDVSQLLDDFFAK